MPKPLLAALLATTALVLHAPLGAAEPTQGEVPYVSGGIGEEELEVIRLVRDDFNVRLTFADNTGAYVSAVHVVISNAHGKPVLEVHDAGPFLLARLPAGHYQVQAVYAGHTLTQNTDLRANRRVERVFRW